VQGLAHLVCWPGVDEVAAVEAAEGQAARRHHDVTHVAAHLRLGLHGAALQQETVGAHGDDGAAIEEQRQDQGHHHVKRGLTVRGEVEAGVGEDDGGQEHSGGRVVEGAEVRLHLPHADARGVVQAQGEQGAGVGGSAKAARADQPLLAPHAKDKVLPPEPQDEEDGLPDAAVVLDVAEHLRVQPLQAALRPCRVWHDGHPRAEALQDGDDGGREQGVRPEANVPLAQDHNEPDQGHGPCHEVDRQLGVNSVAQPAHQAVPRPEELCGHGVGARGPLAQSLHPEHVAARGCVETHALQQEGGQERRQRQGPLPAPSLRTRSPDRLGHRTAGPSLTGVVLELVVINAGLS